MNKNANVQQRTTSTTLDKNLKPVTIEKRTSFESNMSFKSGGKVQTKVSEKGRARAEKSIMDEGSNETPEYLDNAKTNPFANLASMPKFDNFLSPAATSMINSSGLANPDKNSTIEMNQSILSNPANFGDDSPIKINSSSPANVLKKVLDTSPSSIILPKFKFSQPTAILAANKFLPNSSKTDHTFKFNEPKLIKSSIAIGEQIETNLKKHVNWQLPDLTVGVDQASKSIRGKPGSNSIPDSSSGSGPKVATQLKAGSVLDILKGNI